MVLRVNLSQHSRMEHHGDRTTNCRPRHRLGPGVVAGASEAEHGLDLIDGLIADTTRVLGGSHPMIAHVMWSRTNQILPRVLL